MNNRPKPVEVAILVQINLCEVSRDISVVHRALNGFGKRISNSR